MRPKSDDAKRCHRLLNRLSWPLLIEPVTTKDDTMSTDGRKSSEKQSSSIVYPNSSPLFGTKLAQWILSGEL